MPGRIAYLTGHFPMISHTFILREVLALRRRGFDVLTCSVRKPDQSLFAGPDEIAALGSTFYLVEAASNPWRLLVAHCQALCRDPAAWCRALALAWKTRAPGLKALIWQFFYFLESGLLAQRLHEARVTHLHNHFSDSSCTVAMLTSEMLGIPFSFTIHGPMIFFEPRRWALGEKIARARFVATISHFCRSQAMLFSDPVHWAKLHIVHCGVTPSLYGNVQRPSAGGHVVFVGRLDPVKGVPLLLEAFARQHARHPDARLTIVGDGPARVALEAQAQALGLGQATRFAGFQPQAEVARLLEEADMLVLPSFAEGLPVVLMEALASRVPVIATQIAGVPELVRDGIFGFVVPPGDVATLAARIGTLLDDPDLRARMGEAGQKWVAAEFDSDREAAWLGQLLQGQGHGLRPVAEATR